MAWYANHSLAVPSEQHRLTFLDIFVRIWVEVAAQDKAYVIGYILLTFLSVVLMAVVLL